MHRSLNLKAYLLPLFILFLLMLGFTSLSKPANLYCRLCHSQQYNTWQVNKHKDVDCYYCHGQPSGLAGWLKQKADEGRMFAATASRMLSYQPVIGRVKNKYCLHCHQQILVREVVAGQVLVSHREFAKATNCNDCHYVAHRKGKGLLSGMKGCQSCHKEDMTNNCDICHIAAQRRNK